MRTKITISGVEVGEFNDREVDMDLAMRLEDETGWTVPELLEQVGRGSARGLQALVWFTQVQSGKPNPERHMRFRFVDMEMEEVTDEEAGSGKGDRPVKAVEAA